MKVLRDEIMEREKEMKEVTQTIQKLKKKNISGDESVENTVCPAGFWPNTGPAALLCSARALCVSPIGPFDDGEIIVGPQFRARPARFRYRDLKAQHYPSSQWP